MKIEQHGKWALLTDDQGKPIVNKTWWETYDLAMEMSVRTGRKLTLIPVKTAEKLCKTDKAFKKMMIKYWIWNAEIMKACKNTEELRKKLGLKTKYVYQLSDDNGLSSVWSGWYSVGGCFAAHAHRPSDRDDNGVVAFLVKKEKVI